MARYGATFATAVGECVSVGGDAAAIAKSKSQNRGTRKKVKASALLS